MNFNIRVLSYLSYSISSFDDNNDLLVMNNIVMINASEEVINHTIANNNMIFANYFNQQNKQVTHSGSIPSHVVIHRVWEIAESLSNLGLFKFLGFHNQDLIFYSLWSPSYSSEWSSSWFQWECFKMEENIKENSFLSFFSMPHKTLSFLSSLSYAKDEFTNMCNQKMTIFQKLVIWI